MGENLPLTSSNANAARTSIIDQTSRLNQNQQQRSEFSMPSRYFRRQNVSYPTENTPWINRWLQGGNAQLDDVTSFFRTDLDCPSDKHRVKIIRDILHDDALRTFDQTDEDPQAAKIALLIDGHYSTQSNESQLRPFQGPLSAKRLFRELLKPRYQVDAYEPKIIDAERRLLYLTNVDASAILALVLSTPESLGRLLSECLITHLRARAFIGVTFASDGPETFAMELSVPFRAWRSTKRLMLDPRIKQSDGKPLRTSLDVTFLTNQDHAMWKPQAIEGIYSAHLSCLVTGYDQRRWTGVLLVDSWFEEFSEDPDSDLPPDSVQRYEMEHEMHCGVQMDPLSRGRDDVMRSRWYPRSYFLRIMEIRLGQVKHEWEEIIHNLSTLVERYAQTSKSVYQRTSAGPGGLGPSAYQEREANQVGLKIVNMIDVVHEISIDLREVNRSGENFMAFDSRYFVDGHDPLRSGEEENCVPYLRQVRKHFEEIFLLSKRLEDIEKKCQHQLSKLKNDTGKRRYSSKNEGNHVDPIFYRIFWAIVFFGAVNSNLVNYETLRSILNITSIPLTALLIACAVKGLNVKPELSDSLAFNPPYALSTRWDQLRMFHLAKTAFLRTNLVLSGNNSRDNLNCGRVATHMVLNKQHPGSKPPPGRFILHYIQRIRYHNSGNETDHTDVQDDNGVAEFIPVCVRQETAQRSKSSQLPLQRCHDDDTFFLALRNIVLRNLWTWRGLLRACGLQQVVSVHYIKYELQNDDSVIILGRGNIPTKSECGYRTTLGTFNPLCSDCFVNAYRRRAKAMSSTCQVLESIVHQVDAHPTAVCPPCTGYGLEIEEGLNGGRVATLRLVLVVFSLTIGVVTVFATGEIQAGFNVANFFMTSGLVFVAALHGIESSCASTD